jgi:butyryl-CoA dehydrogenase
MARAANVAVDKLAQGNGDASFLRAKIATARYYAENLLPLADAYAQSAMTGSDAALALGPDQF